MPRAGLGRAASRRVSAADEAIACCGNIATISGLLSAAEARAGSDPLEPELAKNAGHLIEQEASRLLELIHALAK